MSVSVKRILMGAAGAAAGNPYGEVLSFGGSQRLVAYDFDSSANLYGYFGNTASFYKFDAGTYTRAWGKDFIYSMEWRQADMAVNSAGNILMTTRTAAADSGVLLSLIDSSTGTTINAHEFIPPSGIDYLPDYNGPCISAVDGVTNAMVIWNSTYLSGAIIAAYFDQTQTSTTTGEYYFQESPTSNSLNGFDYLGGVDEERVICGTSNEVSPQAPFLSKVGLVLFDSATKYARVKKNSTYVFANFEGVSVNSSDATNKIFAVGQVNDPDVFNTYHAHISTFDSNLSKINFRTLSVKPDSSKINVAGVVKCVCDDDGFGYVFFQERTSNDIYLFKIKISDLSIQWQFRITGFLQDGPYNRPVFMNNDNNDIFISLGYSGLVVSKDGLPTGTFGAYTVYETDISNDPIFSMDSTLFSSTSRGNVSGETSYNSTVNTTNNTTFVSVTSTLLE